MVEFDFNALSQVIGSVGFPVVMCVYMMVTNNKTVQANTEATNALKEVVSRLIDKLGKE